MKIKYITLLAVLLAFTACNDPEDVLLDQGIDEVVVVLPELTSGSADFSNYVAVGNSLTAGFTDNALFIAGQQNSLPNILASEFAKVGGGTFTQPLMSDNFGGIAVAGDRILQPRLVFDGAVPVALESLIGPVTVGTDLVLNNPAGPFNNMGVPGARSFHLLAPGYGNLANLSLGLANPYFVRMTGSTPDASVLELAMAQAPSFFSLWIGNNDVLGYATSGGDGTSPITPVDGPPGVGFDQSYGALISTMTSTGAGGVVSNIPYVTSIPHFTTVPHNPLDPTNADFGPQIPTLNAVFGALNQVYEFIGQPERSVVFSTSEASAVVINDEELDDISDIISGALMANPTFPDFVESFGLPPEAAPLVAGLLGATYGQSRQATADELFVLPSSSVIGTVNEAAVGALVAQGLPLQLAGQFSVEGVSLPLADKWVLLPTEQAEIRAAIDSFNATIQTTASSAGLAFVDANALMQTLASGGFTDGEYTLTANLVVGGAFSLDGVHPTARGYAVLANEFLKAIDATYGSNFEASGNFVNVGNYPTNFSPALQ